MSPGTCTIIGAWWVRANTSRAEEEEEEEEEGQAVRGGEWWVMAGECFSLGLTRAANSKFVCLHHSPCSLSELVGENGNETSQRPAQQRSVSLAHPSCHP